MQAKDTLTLNLQKELTKLDNEFEAWVSKEKYRKKNKIKSFLRYRSDIVDTFILNLWTESGLQNNKELGLFAVGGYGRRELHPHSDIDLLILSKDKIKPLKAKKIESLIQGLWDQGFSVGHSVRTIKEAKSQCENDISSATNILESRLIYGQKKISDSLEKIIVSPNIWKGKNFLQAKIEEQKLRHKKYDNTEFNLEPNIKSSPGGLRDIQIISWLMIKYSSRTLDKKIEPEEVLTKSESQELINSRNWIWIMRYLLHVMSNREEDRLLFEYQILLGKKLFPSITNEHQAAEMVMKKYYQAAFNISEINNTVVKSFKEKLLYKKKSNIKDLGTRYEEKHNLIELKDSISIKKSPYILLEIFYELCKKPYLNGIGPKTLRKLKENRTLIDKKFRHNKRNANLFMSILRSPRLMVSALEEMNRLRLLGKYLPPFGRVTGQMQYDLFHIYTVDAHTIEVLRNMRRLFLGSSKESYPLASELIHTLPKLELLYIAGLFHDLGKGTGKDHSIEGIKTVRKFCKKHDLNKTDTELTSWLVGNHLSMSTTSQKEDLSNPKVIANFATNVGNLIKLKYLYCLTVADITATNPSLWNNWKATLLRELFHKTKNYLQTRAPNNRGISQVESIKKDAYRILLSSTSVKKREIDNIWQNFYSSYFKNINYETLVWHTKELHKRTSSKSLVKIKISLQPSIEETSQLMIYTKDRPNVFGSILSILDKNNLQILDAKLHETKDKNCIDSITICDLKGHHINKNLELIKKLEKDLSSLLDNKNLKQQNTIRRFPNKLKNFQTNTVIKIKHDMTNRWTQMDIETLDGPGKLLTITNILSQHKASIIKARISTLGERVEDRFCITSDQGTPFIKQVELNKLVTNLKNTLDTT